MIHVGPGDDDFAASVAIPRGNAMPPPELARDAPVADVTHPCEIVVGELWRNELGSSLLHRRGRDLREWFDFNEPLRLEKRFNNRMDALAVSDVVRERLGLNEKTFGFQIFHNTLAGFG